MIHDFSWVLFRSTAAYSTHIMAYTSSGNYTQLESVQYICRLLSDLVLRMLRPTDFIEIAPEFSTIFFGPIRTPF